MQGAITLIIISLVIGFGLIVPILLFAKYALKKLDDLNVNYDLNDIKGNPIATAIYGGLLAVALFVLLGFIFSSIILGSFI
jgi:alpha-N-acetylglucosamine transferase